MKHVAKAIIFDERQHILVLYRSSTHPYFANHIDFPGGEVEGSESPAIAAQREISEEVGIQVGLDEVRLLPALRTQPEHHHVFLVQLDARPEIRLSWEHLSYTWMTVTQLLHTPLPDNVDDYHLTILNQLSVLQIN